MTKMTKCVTDMQGGKDSTVSWNIPGEASYRSSDVSKARAAPSGRKGKDPVAGEWCGPTRVSGTAGCTWETGAEPV